MSKLNVLYEDNHVIVVVKPFNVLSQSDNTKDLDMLTIVKQYIKEKYNKPGNVYLGLVHRLDRPTLGVMVFAKTSKAASRLSEQVRNNTFGKKYVAIVNGILSKKEDIFIDYLKKLDNGNTVVSDKDNGKLAELSYKVLKEDKINNLSLVDISLKTGRHHQIRVQFSSRGYPLLGDSRYSENKEKNQLCLIAYTLNFNHPITKERLEFSIPFEDLEHFRKFYV